MFYTNPSFLVLFVFFLFILVYTILKKEKNHKTLIRKVALQEDYRQKYRHYEEHFISPSVVGLYISEVLKHRFCLTSKTKTWKPIHYKIASLPCFFGFLTSTTFARKKNKFSPFYWVYWMFLPKFATYINHTS